MKAIILAAGEGTRLRPLTSTRPKPMLPIAGTPLLEHTIGLLKSHGITDCAINLNYMPESIRGYFGDGSQFGVDITYSLENEILGTAGAVRKLQAYLDSTFVVFYGDVLTDLDIGALAAFHKKKLVSQTPSGSPIVTLALYHVENPSAAGIVEIDRDSRIRRFIEKPSPEEAFTDLANAGIMIVEPEIIDYIPPGTFCDFGHDLLPRLLEKGVALYGFEIAQSTYLLDIGTHPKYRRANWEWPRIHAKA